MIRLTVLTTSFPLSPDSVSGLFIQRLVTHLPAAIETTVITPCATTPIRSQAQSCFKLHCFRYAPVSWQRLAQQPGGIPVALRKRKSLYLLVPFFLMAMFLACLRVARKSDVIHAHWSVNGVVAGLAGWLTRTAVLTTLRGEDVNRLERSRLSALFLRLCLLLNRRVVTVSSALRRTVARRYPAQAHKLVMIPNGVDGTLLSLRPRGGGDGIRLLTIGSLIARKGVDQVLVALSQLPGSPGVELTIIGDGPERTALESLAISLNLASQVRFAGGVPPDQVPRHLERADIFILASHSEGRPNVVLEAMAAGLPVIATHIEGTDELIEDGETGLLFEPGRPNQLARRIATLVENPELRKRLGTAARQFIIDNRLSWQETARFYAGLYRELVPQAKRKGIA